MSARFMTKQLILVQTDQRLRFQLVPMQRKNGELKKVAFLEAFLRLVSPSFSLTYFEWKSLREYVVGLRLSLAFFPITRELKREKLSSLSSYLQAFPSLFSTGFKRIELWFSFCFGIYSLFFFSCKEGYAPLKLVPISLFLIHITHICLPEKMNTLRSQTPCFEASGATSPKRYHWGTKPGT